MPYALPSRFRIGCAACRTTTSRETILAGSQWIARAARPATISDGNLCRPLLALAAAFRRTELCVAKAKDSYIKLC